LSSYDTGGSVFLNLCSFFIVISWNEVYEKELADFEDTGDEGEIW
jgi:hypothetical protein